MRANRRSEGNFPEHWLRPTPLSSALLPLSWVFAALVALRRALYRRGLLGTVRLPVPVVVVGNVTVGGTGKTPLVLALVERLREAGYRPGVITRGYGGTARLPCEVKPADDPQLAGDESVLLAQRCGCPVVSGRDRVAAARKLLALHPRCDVVVSDDGLQHYRLARDLEIAVEDARGHGNARMLPAGPLREPAGRSLDALVVNGKPHPSRRAAIERMPQHYFMELEPRGFYALGGNGRPVGPRELAGRRLHALAGIGDPQRFFRTLSDMGLEFVEHPFADHHAYRAADVAFAGCDALLMTEKDAVKCARLLQESVPGKSDSGWYALRVRARLDDSFFDFIRTRLREAHHGHPSA
jgi:tetraacyldisaccharide 4'-kinase